MKSKKIIFTSLLFALAVFLPLIASAHGLVPCGGPGEHPCTACDLLVLIQNVIQFTLKMAVLAIIGLFVYAGFDFMTSGGNAARIKRTQHILISSLVGLGIILSAWVIVNTTFWLIARAGGKDYTGNWYHIECSIPSPATSNGNSNSNSNK